MTTLFRAVREALRNPRIYTVMDDSDDLSIVGSNAIDRWIDEHGRISANADEYRAFCHEVEHLRQFGVVGSNAATRIAEMLKKKGAGFIWWDCSSRQWIRG